MDGILSTKQKLISNLDRQTSENLDIIFEQLYATFKKCVFQIRTLCPAGYVALTSTFMILSNSKEELEKLLLTREDPWIIVPTNPEKVFEE